MKKNRLLPSFRRNLRRLMMPLAVCSVALIAASCSTDDNDTPGEPLPEGMYPIEFTATGLQATPQTRATADDTWNGGENVAIQIDEVVKQYNAKSSGSTTELTPANDNDKFYWQNKNNTIVQAWYYGTGYNNTYPTKWTVKDNQASTSEYQQSDFLYAQDKFGFGEDNALNFYHQTAKVVINIRKKGVLTNVEQIKGTTIDKVYLNGNFSEPASGSKYGLSGTSGSLSTITPEKTSPNANVNFGGTVETALASYRALVIPQTINEGSNLFKIEIEGYSPFYYTVPAGGIEWKAGTEHTYNITIEGSELSVTTSSSIGWGTDGASGSGSVTLPEIIDLSTEPATINDDGVYRIQGNGKETANTITISNGSPTVYLENVNIKAATTGGINITGGSPTLIIQGADNKIVSTMDSGIAVSNGATVTIKGNSTEDVLNANGGNGDAGIGSPLSGATAGNISINNVKINATGGSVSPYFGGAGIGSSSSGNCGDITITDAVITANGGDRSPGIGIGYGNSTQPSIGKITITNSDVTAKAGLYASAIGLPFTQSAYDINTSPDYKAGQITITTDNLETFLSKLTTGGTANPNYAEYAQRIGKGSHGKSYTPSILNQNGTGPWEGVVINNVAYKNGVE